MYLHNTAMNSFYVVTMVLSAVLRVTIPDFDLYAVRFIFFNEDTKMQCKHIKNLKKLKFMLFRESLICMCVYR